jgi:hypothetical protein
VLFYKKLTILILLSVNQSNEKDYVMEKNINFETLKNIENAVANLQDNFYKYSD